MPNHYEYAFIANQVYAPNGGTPPEGWQVIATRYADNEHGFGAAAYKNEAQKEIIIEDIFKTIPVKTIKSENKFHRLFFFSAKSPSSNCEENSDESQSNSKDFPSSQHVNKRSFAEMGGEVTEEPSPKRHKL